MIFGHDCWNISAGARAQATGSAFLPLIGSDFDNTLEDDGG
jgi:hypothetical protein